MGNKTSIARKRSQRDYTLGFKLSVIEQIEKGEMTYKQAQTRYGIQGRYKQAQETYGIQGRSTVLVWLRKHGKLDWSSPGERPMKPSKETPIQQIKRLERELEDERMKTLLLNEMIDIIDNDYGGNIRKKRLPEALKTYNIKEK